MQDEMIISNPRFPRRTQKRKWLRIVVILLMSLLLKTELGLGAQPAGQTMHQDLTIKRGDVELKVLPYKRRNARAGVVCLYGGEPFSMGSGFGVSSLNWKETHLGFGNPNDFDVGIRTESNGCRSIVFDLHGAGGQGRIRYTVMPDNILDIECSVKLSIPAGRVAFDVFRLEPAAFLGLPFTAKEKGGKSMDLSFAAFLKTEKRLVLLKDFEEFSIDSRLGPIEIKRLPGSTLPLQVADWRGKKWPPMPYLYVGTSGAVLKAGKQGIIKLRVRLPKSLVKGSGITRFIGTDKWRKTDVVLPVTSTCPQLYPTPKTVTWSGGTFRLSSRSDLVFKNVPEEDQRKLAALLHAIVVRKYGFALHDGAGKTKAGSMELCLSKTLSGKSPEYYELSVKPEKIVIRANEPIGLRHGIGMIGELLWADPKDPGVICVDIEDWPSLRMRGVHCFSGRNAAALQTKFVERIFSPAKLNTIVYECGYVKWDATPLAHFEKYGMEKAQAAHVIAAMRANYLEPIPLIQSIGHIDWLNRNVIDETTGRRAYGEYLVSPTAYGTCFDPRNKKGHEFLKKVYDEVIAMFAPQYFHLGFDECLVGSARLVALSKTAGVPPEELFVDQLLILRAYLAARNIRTMIWGDILLKRGEEAPDYGHAPSLEAAKAMRKRIPKDVLIADWHYGNHKPEKYISIGVLQKDGFEVLGSTALSPGNLIGFNAALKQAESLGHLQTTWAGFSFDPASFDKLFPHYYSYVLGAEVAWNGDYERVEDVPFSFDEKFVELWTQDDFSRFMKPGAKHWSVDLSEVANLALAGKRWLGMSVANAPGEIDALASGTVRFQMAGAGGIGKAVLFDAKYNPAGSWPEKLVVSAARKMDALLFVQAASMRGKWDEEIARYVLTYSDDCTHAVPLRYGRNIFWYAETCNGRLWDNHNSPLLWQSQSKAGQPVAVRYLKVDNPYPDKVIKSVTIESAGNVPGLMLFGLAGLAM